VLPIAASILMVAATYFYWVGREETKAPTHFQQMSPEIVSHPPNSARSPVQPTPLVHAVTITIQSPTRGPITPTAPRVYTLPRGIVDLTLEMPMGYGEGTFKVQISGKKSKLEYRVNAHSQGGLIRIQSRVDFSAFEPGPYQLTVGKLEESAKYAVPLQID